MSVRSMLCARWLPLAALSLAVAATIVGSPSAAKGQAIGAFRAGAVGGIAIDPEGVIGNLTVDQLGELHRLRQQALRPVEGEVKHWSDMRMVSLKGLEAAVAESRDDPSKRPDEVAAMAGLQRVRYIFINPDEHDIILAGPAEGWKVDSRGNVVGLTSGRPVLLLDDLLVAVRSAIAAAQGGLTCSIDPTTEGLDRLQRFVKTQSVFTPEVTANMERALGMQNITIQGVPLTSHFAGVMLAADYRMKRLAMEFDPTPLQKMPSYLRLISARANGVQNINPRWWLATNYDSLLKDPDGLAWEIRGPGVRCMTEDEIVGDGGVRTRTGKASGPAQQWADTMTARYDELAKKEPIFDELRNVMDLSVVAALITKENLVQRAGASLPLLTESDGAELSASLNVPKQVPSIAKAVSKGGKWIISTSGGVEIASWQAAANVEESSELADVREKSVAKQVSSWWWD